MVRDLRWPGGVDCPHCQSKHVAKNGHDTTEVFRQRYVCRGCGRWFDDLTNTVFAGHHRPLKTWMLCSYFMGLNLSNQQIAAELGLSKTVAFEMTKKLRQGIVDRTDPFVLEGEVECDEVYVVAGHKGHPEAVKKRAKRASSAFEGSAGSWHIGERKAAHLWDDSARGPRHDADACERAAKNNPADYRIRDRFRDESLYRRVRHLLPTFGMGLSAPDRLPQQRRVCAG